MRKLFIPLLLFSALEAHQKDGFFIEAGFETGLLEGTQTQEKRYTTTKNTYGTYDYLPTYAVVKRASYLFTDANSISQLKFSTKTPISVRMSVINSADGKSSKTAVVVENFLPYNLNNVKLFFKDNEGKVIDLGVLETIPKYSKIVLPEKLFKNLQTSQYTFHSPHSPTNIEVSSTSISDANTKRVFEALSKITTNLMVNYRNENKFNYNGSVHSENYENFTPQTAKKMTNLLLNMIAVLDSQSWNDAILNAPFQFMDNHNALKPQEIVNNFRNKMNLDVSLLKGGTGLLGLGVKYNVNHGALGVITSAIEPEKLFGRHLHTINLADLGIILHEFSHTKGYTHDGNMTYSPSSYNVCSHFNGQGQPAFPSNYPNSIYHNCADVPAGFLGVTTAVWQQLINQNALPINYANLGSQRNYNLNATLNTQDLANSMFGTIQKTFLTSSVTNHHTSRASQNFKSPLLGVNVKIGYQNYFNNFIGLAYYAIVKYNYAKASSEKVQQLSYGGGVELLVDFITTYSKKTKNNQTKKVFSSSFGMFGGVRGLYNSYYVLNKIKGAGNLDAVTGFNYRYKHSKFSVGVAIPLIQTKAKVVAINDNYTNSFVFKEGSSHFKVFFNYGWVF
ncbi:outer membrane protein [Helicobacter pylori]|nr:outer membrane protein [Helicobacter pylori]